MNEGCEFCRIAEGLEPVLVLYETSTIIAFAPIREDILSPGHFLIIPKFHVSNFMGLSSELHSEIISAIKIIMESLEKKFKYTGFNIMSANGKSAQQSIDHVHFHIIPRCEGDNFDLWPKTTYIEQDYENRYSQMEQAINSNIKETLKEIQPEISNKIKIQFTFLLPDSREKEIEIIEEGDCDFLSIIESAIDEIGWDLMEIKINSKSNEMIGSVDLYQTIRNVKNRHGSRFFIKKKDENLSI